MSKKYSEEDKNYLRENYSTESTVDIASVLNRDIGAIRAKTSKMGLKKKINSKATPLRLCFWEKVDIKEPDECWEWLGYKRPTGSGRMTVDGKQVSTTEICWKLNYGEIPKDYMIFRSCGNISCVNPNHFRLETQQEKDYRRFWEHVKINTKSGCWEWSGARQDFGYGIFWEDGKSISSHRYSWKLFVGNIPENMFICHHCDNPSCVNPDHLFFGTQKDNMRDMVNKGRQARGEGHGRSILTKDNVLFIRNNAEKYTRAQLTKIFNMDRTTIDKVITRDLWGHI